MEITVKTDIRALVKGMKAGGFSDGDTPAVLQRWANLFFSHEVVVRAWDEKEGWVRLQPCVTWKNEHGHQVARTFPDGSITSVPR